MNIKFLTVTVLSSSILALIACANDTKTESNSNSSPSSSTSTATQMHPGEKLISKSDCIGCHAKTSKVIGPSYQDIAAKYENNTKNVEMLAEKIIKGSSGVWGNIPMTPHANVSKADAESMVKFIMTLKK